MYHSSPLEREGTRLKPSLQLLNRSNSYTSLDHEIYQLVDQNLTTTKLIKMKEARWIKFTRKTPNNVAS